MESEDTKKKLDRLARVRENQRNSRARKQEYIRELEQQLVVCKGQTQQNDIKHRLAIQKVEAENRQLKTLLASVGISPGLIEQYLQSANHGTELDRKIAIPAIQRRIHGALSPSSSSKDGVDLIETCSPSPNTYAPAGSSPPEQSVSQNTGLTEPALCKCPTENQELTSWPHEEDVLNSTLCAIAEELVSQYNTRGVDPEEVRQRLWSGFRASSSGNGCRVQNQVLFQVLDELSNDM
ncbi:hypothetical protein N7492_001112 [Penicillium capsulatum]|uniref:BZIP domain-containing protein n=1 Tax=Penicillium capsulatum TaxID=69766 RepID=A0A9W9IX26_9EURO|nr:hypothetical protein N7492_001112 [Penicillium capsulatum]